MDDLFVGILAGVLSTGLLCVAAIVFKSVVTPWLHSLFYRGPNISGDWKGFDDQSEGAEHVSTTRIRQKGTIVVIDIERFKKRSDHSPCQRRLQYNGKFSSGTLIALYEDLEMKDFIIGAMVLSISTDNKTLSGKVVYYDKNVGNVVSPDYFLKRAN